MLNRRETNEEFKERKKGNFQHVEQELTLNAGSVLRISPWFSSLSYLLGKRNPLGQRADPARHTVWLFDNTAYQSPHQRGDQVSVWNVELVACILETHGREDMGRWVAIIADMVGVDGNMGMDGTAIRKRIAQRVQPFVNAVVPSRFISLEVPLSRTEVHKYRTNLSGKDGLVNHLIRIHPSHRVPDRMSIRPFLRQWPSPPVAMTTTFAAPAGWAIISDVDDTIKYTQTPDAIGILRTTFVEDPKPIAYMPELYQHIQTRLNPAWFYLSASPYNLYRFLCEFLRSFYPQGTLLLRDGSWMDLPGLLKSFTTGTQAYKVDRMNKLHRCFPKRKILCIGDSTQSDPEAYAEMYRKSKPWIKAIFIRRVTDVANMERKNTDERFEKAFRGIPRTMWKIFDHPDQLFGLIDDLQAKYP
ncbi:hypothetical protein FQN57_004299 [Myotisia sp. PD_48]|nr:hypothetical protein FQN57_004299 [Myotisia sp. PD_48]